MSTPRVEALLELHAAATPFLRQRTFAGQAERERLRRAVVTVMCERGMIVPADLITSEEEALDALRAIVGRCMALRCSWPEIVAIVNRETTVAERRA